MVESHSDRNKRIAKNTLFLYCRTFLVMIVGLYAGRLLLEALGIDNYGINNVVGGIIAFSSLITSNLAAASSRYITYSLGKDDLEEGITVFSNSFWIQIYMAIIAIIAIEIGGLWFLNYAANISEGRMFAANWVFQCSVLTMVVNLIGVPYHASIIAHERMSVFAYTGIADAVLKLAVCFAILHFGGDRLILYSTLYLIIVIVLTIFNVIYSHLSFNEVKIIRKIDKKLVQEMFGFSGWNCVSQTAYVLNTQGVNLLVNIFFGVAFNAARGVAVTVSTCTQSFVGNFTMAFNPQITKSYAAGDYNDCYSLVNKGGKFSWYLLLLFAVPVCIEAKTLLSLWLVDVPPEAALFLQFSMIEAIALISSQILVKLIQTIGKIKAYSIKSSIFSAMAFPIVWIAYRLGAPVWFSYPVLIIINFLLIFYRFGTLKKVSTYDPHTYLIDVLKPCLHVTILSFLLPAIVSFMWPASTLRFFILVPLSVLYVGALEFSIGLTRSEKVVITSKLHAFLAKRH